MKREIKIRPAFDKGGTEMKRKLKKGEWIPKNNVKYCLACFTVHLNPFELEISQIVVMRRSGLCNKAKGEYPTRRAAEAAIRRIKKAMAGK